MADIRINALATTAASTASDDFIAIDGSANGTRKLNAYSPTFGGNLTVSGTGNSSIAGNLLFPVNKYVYFDGSGAAQTATIGVPTGTNDLYIGNNNALLVLERVSGESYFNVGGTEKLRVGASATTLAGNLTVSGGTIGTAASTNLTLNGGSSGASLVLGQGTNGAATLTSNGSGRTTFTTPRTNTFGQLFTNSGTVAANDRVGFLFGFNGVYTNSGIAAQILDNGSTGAEDVVIYTGTNATGAGEAARFKNTGNLLIGTTTDGGQKLQVNGTAAISGALSIGNTVQTAASVASTHKVTISIGGSTYYLLATNV